MLQRYHTIIMAWLIIIQRRKSQGYSENLSKSLQTLAAEGVMCLACSLAYFGAYILNVTRDRLSHKLRVVVLHNPVESDVIAVIFLNDKFTHLANLE